MVELAYIDTDNYATTTHLNIKTTDMLSAESTITSYANENGGSAIRFSCN